MFKQRLIPLAGAALLLFSCGGGNNVIKLDKLVDGGEGIKMFVSKKIAAKKGASITLSCSFEKLGKDYDFSSLTSFAFSSTEDVDEESAIDAIDEITNVTYNGKQVKCFGDPETEPDILEKWMKEIGKGEKEGKANNTYLCSNDLMMNKDGEPKILMINHFNAKESDTIKVTFKCAYEGDMYALCANTGEK